MKKKPQVHFWVEPVEINAAKGLPSVYAVNCCRAWDVPANGVFMLCTSEEVKKVWNGNNYNYGCAGALIAKLEAREEALVSWYGRQARHHLDQFDLTPRERQKLAIARAAQHERGNASSDF